MLGEPVNLETGAHFSKPARDRQIASPMAEPDGGRKIEDAIAPRWPPAKHCGHGNAASRAIREITNEPIHHDRFACNRHMTRSFQGQERRSYRLGHSLPTC